MQGLALLCYDSLSMAVKMYEKGSLTLLQSVHIFLKEERKTEKKKKESFEAGGLWRFVKVFDIYLIPLKNKIHY